MELIRAVAIEFAKDKELNGKWPEAVDGQEQATKFTQVSSYEIEFDATIQVIERSYGTYQYSTYECTGLPYIEEYENGDTVTKEEYEAFVAANPTLLEDITALTPINIAKIADLNTQIAALIDEITELSDQIGIEVNIDLGQHGTLNPNSDWDSSHC